MGLLVVVGCGADVPVEKTRALKTAKSKESTTAPSEPTPEQLDAAKKAVTKLGGRYQPRTDRQTNTKMHIFRVPPDKLKQMPDLPFGFILDFGYDVEITDNDLKEMQRFKNLTGLQLDFSKGVTDAGLEHLASLKNLTRLHLEETGVKGPGVEKLIAVLPRLDILGLESRQMTDEILRRLRKNGKLHGLIHLAGGPGPDYGSVDSDEKIRVLILRGSQVTDVGLKELRGLNNLTRLDLRFTRVTDTGLNHLQEFKKLAQLNLTDTGVTDAGVEQFRKAHPDCSIRR